MTKRYIAYATISYDLVCEFDLEDDDETDPWEFAKEIDGADFSQIDHSGDWKVYEVQEIK